MKSAKGIYYTCYICLIIYTVNYKLIYNRLLKKKIYKDYVDILLQYRNLL